LVAVQMERNSLRVWDTYPNFLDWQRENHSLETIAAWRDENVNLTGDGEPERLIGKMVSSTFFPTLGIQPILGHNFSDDDDQLGAAPVALLSEGLWKSRFGGSRDILGRNIMLDGKDYTVVGIIPSRFRFPRSQAAGEQTDPDEVFTPIGQWDSTFFRDRAVSAGMYVIGRLKPNVALAQARADLDVLGQALAVEYPDADGGSTITAVPLKADIIGNLRPVLLILLGAVSFVLLIACVNVANLLLARSTHRAQEFAIRASLGASRGQIVRQLLTESLLLSLLGGMAALLFAYLGTGPALKFLPLKLPAVVRVSIDGWALMFAFGACIIISVLFGMAPALHASRRNSEDALKGSGRAIILGLNFTQSALTAAEVAFAVILLIGAGLMIRSLARLFSVNPGFDSHNLMAFVVVLPPQANPDPDTMRERHREVLERLSVIPGVESVSLSFASLPMDGQGIVPYWLEGEPRSSLTDARRSLWFPVAPGYLDTMHIPLLKGRNLGSSDTHTSPKVIVIDEKLAQSAFAGQDPIGKRIYIDSVGLAQIVGVAGHVKQIGLDENPTGTIQAQFYIPFEQIPDEFQTAGGNIVSVVLRSSVRPDSVLAAIRRQLKTIDDREFIWRVRLIGDIVRETQAPRRFSMFLLISFAAIALLLAVVGIYGVISYVVSQSTHEVGIRMALGAQKHDVLKMVIRRGMKQVLVGMVIGIAGALVLSQLLSSLLFGVAPTDPATFISVALLLFATALWACYVPARRATRVEPMVALRYE